MKSGTEEWMSRARREGVRVQITASTVPPLSIALLPGATSTVRTCYRVEHMAHQQLRSGQAFVHAPRRVSFCQPTASRRLPPAAC